MSTTLSKQATLIPQEQARLEHLEQEIEAGIKTFLTVGNALAEVRESRLYRSRYETFESYCSCRWSLSRSRAYQMIEAAEVVSTIVDTGAPAPTNEGQARALAAAPPEERADVMTAVAEKGKPTAAAITEEIEARAEPTTERNMISVEDIFPDPQEREDILAFGDASEDEFEEALATSEAQGDLSRANVRANLRPPPPPAGARRKSLPGQIRRTTYDLRLALNRVEKLVDDDRFERIKGDGDTGNLRAQLARSVLLYNRVRSGADIVNASAGIQ